MILNQYARYRVNQTTKGKKLWHITYQEAFTQKIPIRIEYYKLMEIQSLQEGENLRKLWNRIQEQCEVSDIIVVNQAGTISSYYVDGKLLYPFPGFIRKETGGSVISHDTENYEIKGKKGKWIVTDERIIDGKNFYLLEHQTYRNQAGAMILDREGKLILEDVKNGFVKDNIEKIQKLERQQKIEYNHKQRLQQRYSLYQKKTEEKKQSYLLNAEC